MRQFQSALCLLICSLVVQCCCAQHPTEERAFAIREIRKISKEYKKRRENQDLQSVRYRLEGTWTAPKNGFIGLHESESDFPPHDIVKDYSSEILIDVSTRQYQIGSNSYNFFTSRGPPVGTTIWSRNHSYDWDGVRLLIFERDHWPRKRNGEMSFWQPDITVRTGDKRGSAAEFLPFFFAHGHLLVTYAAKQPSNYFDWLLFDHEDEFQGHDCIVLRDIDGRRKYWLARDLDYSVVKFWDTWGPRKPHTEIVIDYESKGDELVVKSFQLAMYSGREIASRIIDAEVTSFESGLDFLEQKKQPELETGMMWIDVTAPVLTDPGRYAGYLIGADKQKYPLEVFWRFDWWIP